MIYLEEEIPYAGKWNYIDESQTYYVEQEKPNTKEYILYDFVGMKFKKRQS